MVSQCTGVCCSSLKKRGAVAAGQVGHRSRATIAPEQPIRKDRDVTNVNAGANHAAPLDGGGQRQRHQRPDRSKNQVAIEQVRRRLVRRTELFRAQGSGIRLSFVVIRSSESVHVLTSSPCDLNGQMLCGPKP